MGFLDLFEKDQSISMRPQPNEGTELPGYYELHRQEIWMGAAILVSAALLIAIFRYRMYLRGSLITVLAGAMTLYRSVAAKARLIWSEVEDRADRPL
jgi:hypothetical protein